MTIKSEIKPIIVFLSIVSLLAAFFLYLETDSILCFYVMLLILYAFIFRYWLAFGRTITIGKDRCIVSFLGYKKVYRWDELKTKRYVQFENSLGYRSPYVAGAEFCEKNVNRPVWLEPKEYCESIRPLSYFFVYFKPDSPPSTRRWYPLIYTVDEKEFREKINQLGIFLE